MCTEEPEARKLRRRRASFSKTLAAARLLGVGIACSPMPSNPNQSEKPRAARPTLLPRRTLLHRQRIHVLSSLRPCHWPTGCRPERSVKSSCRLASNTQDFAGSGDHAWLLADERVYRHDGRKNGKRALALSGCRKAYERHATVSPPRNRSRRFCRKLDPDEERVIADFRSVRASRA